jgi:hypothetical protein
MMKKNPRKLTLSRETLHRLETADLRGLNGGAVPHTVAVRDCVSEQIRTCGCATSPC